MIIAAIDTTMMLAVTATATFAPAKPRWNDLDANQPVNNVKYVGLMLESTVPITFLKNHELAAITMEYKRECAKDDACYCPGRRQFFYSVDLEKASVDKIGTLTGREEKSLEVFEVSPGSSNITFVGYEGYILLVSTKTKDLIGTLNLNGTARALAFADHGRQLLSFGGDWHIYHWNLRTRTCFHKGVDEGCVYGSALCTSPNGSLFADGSESGIVNIYNRESSKEQGKTYRDC
ncbi:hypothetical protein NE237_030480 [Protea cynaroides]|uniref:Acyl-ACP thioesterase-like C-terminal domain-containing protein n=1 Tax=Protea cynaroides TaxID=273540 RepID=A0A9Q0GW11_9MAGN|nr:hypothetical protein NE237_030480 [Protea cynaroides]